MDTDFKRVSEQTAETECVSLEEYTARSRGTQMIKGVFKILSGVDVGKNIYFYWAEYYMHYRYQGLVYNKEDFPKMLGKKYRLEVKHASGEFGTYIQVISCEPIIPSFIETFW